MRPRRLLRPLTVLLLVQVVPSFLPHLAADAAAGCGPAGGRLRGEVRFLVLGDWGREGSRTQREVARRLGMAAEEGTDFVITTGDNFYERGVTSVDDPAWERSFREVYTAPCLEVPWSPVLGNHDYRGSTAAQIEFSRGDSRWSMPDRYYSFRRSTAGGEVLFVFLDTSPFVEKYRWMRWKYPDLASQDAEVQLAWLEETLAESPAAWKVVVGHHPIFSGGEYHGPAGELRERVMPLFEEYGVTIYFSGHEHNLQHLKPPGLTHYVISGGGSGSRPAGETEDTRFAAALPGFVSASLSEEGLRLRFVGSGGEVLYETLISR